MTDYIIDLPGEEISEKLKLIATKQDEIKDLDTIRTNAQKGATALQSVPDEYITEEELEAKGYAVARNVTNALATKVPREEGKGLSTEDFTTALKNKLESLQNYDDTAIIAAITKLRNDFDTLVQSDTSGAIDKFNEIIAFLDGIEDSQSLDNIIASIEQQIADKQDVITDLDDIRANSNIGAKAIRSVRMNKVTYSEGQLSPFVGIDLGNVVTKIRVNGRDYAPVVDAFSNPGTGLIDLGDYYTKNEVDSAIASAITTTLNTPV